MSAPVMLRAGDRQRRSRPLARPWRVRFELAGQPLGSAVRRWPTEDLARRYGRQLVENPRPVLDATGDLGPADGLALAHRLHLNGDAVSIVVERVPERFAPVGA